MSSMWKQWNYCLHRYKMKMGRIDWFKMFIKRKIDTVSICLWLDMPRQWCGFPERNTLCSFVKLEETCLIFSFHHSLPHLVIYILDPFHFCVHINIISYQICIRAISDNLIFVCAQCQPNMSYYYSTVFLCGRFFTSFLCARP